MKKECNFPQYPKVECSYEACCKPRWQKSEEAITINLYGKILSIPRSKIRCTYNVLILCAMIKTPNYVQFYTKHNTLGALFLIH